MDKQTKLTLDELVRRKLQIQEAKKKRKTKSFYIESLEGVITLAEPTTEIVTDMGKMEASDRINKYLLYNCIVEPDLKSQELQKEFGVFEPYDIVTELFSVGEIAQLAEQAMELAGFEKGVTPVDEIKNS